MPRKRKTTKMVRRRRVGTRTSKSGGRRVVRGGRKRRMKGKGFLDWAKSANKWLKKTKLISKAGKALGSVGVPYAGEIGSVAGAVGYGRRRKRTVRRRRRGRGSSLAGGRRGRGSSLAGGGVFLAGAGNRKKNRSMRPLGIAY